MESTDTSDLEALLSANDINKTESPSPVDEDATVMMMSSAATAAYDTSSESHRIASTSAEDGTALRQTSSSKPSGAVLTVLPDVKHMAPKSPLLFDALSEKKWDLAEALISENHGLKYTSTHHNGVTVLHAAILYQAPTPLIRMLLERGLDPNMPNNWKRTPLYIAARHNVSPEVMHLLLAAGGDLNRRDDFQYTPLMASSYNGASLSLISRMLAMGARVSDVDNYGKRAVDWAAEGNHPEIVAYLSNIGLVEALCSVYIPRLGNKSALRLFGRDLMMALRDMLCIPNRPIPPKRPIVFEG